MGRGVLGDDKEDERGWCSPHLLRPFERGLIQLKATGAGCLLVKSAVLRAMAKPLWRLGQITPDGWGDDMNFCHRVREAGFEIWADLDVLVGHVFTGVIWPAYNHENGQWATALVQRGAQPLFAWPSARPQASIESAPARPSPFLGVTRR